jgi:4-hydroxy-3-polyprenylbenzoate decarboxylase
MSITHHATPHRIIFGISGSSGAPYGPVLLRYLLAIPHLEIHTVVTNSATIVMGEELGLVFPQGKFDPLRYLSHPLPGHTEALPATGYPGLPDLPAKDEILLRLIFHRDQDVAAPPASGSFRNRGMIICPCSMRTLATIATGTGASLLTRAADATLKERRPLVLVPRETPLNLIHLRNMVTVTEAGATVLPAMPGFYHQPQSILDLLRFLVMKILDAARLDHPAVQSMRWKDRSPESQFP